VGSTWSPLEEQVTEQYKSPGRSDYGAVPHVGENSADYRERMALIQTEASERRQKQLEEQCSPLNTPSARIRIWERLHQLELPRSPGHRLIAVIAANTGLSPEDVRAEQQSRATTPVGASTPDSVL
jgi:hypothetical protein